MSQAGNAPMGFSDWLRQVPQGGLWLLAGVLAMLLALLCRGMTTWVGAESGLVPVQLILTGLALILCGYSLSVRLRTGGGLAGSTVTGAGLVRLLALLGLVAVLLALAPLLITPAENARIQEALKTPTSPGGGLPDGIQRDGEGNPLLVDGKLIPYPWMSYTYMVVMALGVIVTLCVALALLLKWTVRQKYDGDEQPSGNAQTITLVMVAGCAVVLLLAYSSLASEWTSGRDFLCALTLVLLVGGVLLTLPMAGRKVMASLLILLHFGGILTAVTAVEPPGAPAPWVATKLWTVVYRPYLQFMYMNNAYHFYSPEPGPANVLRVRFQYEDGQALWVQLPSRSKSSVPMTYQRVLALTESINQMGPPTGNMQVKEENRKLAERLYRGGPGIPMHPELMPSFQYREPTPYAKELTSSYVRYLAREYATYKGQNLFRIRLYRVTHSIVTAPQLAEGRHADDPWLYMPYYQGEFDTEGKLLDPNDPLLYWLIPVLIKGPTPDPNNVLDYLPIHAGDIKENPR